MFTAAYADPEPMRSEIDTHSGLLVLEFGSPGCGFCIAAQPLLRRMLGPNHALAHRKIEDGKGRPLGRSFGVKWWPTLILLRDGQELARAVRPRHPDDLTGLFAALGSDVPSAAID